MQFFHISHTTLWPLPSPVVNVIVKCHCITNDVVTNQVMVLPPQFNISSSPHCPFSNNFIQSTTQKILCCQCHLSNTTVSLHHCLFIPDPFSCSKFFNTATWCLPYCRSESNSAMFILHPPASLFPPLPALIMGNSLICWFHWTLQDQPLTALRPS